MADPVEIRSRQYSLEGRRNGANGASIAQKTLKHVHAQGLLFY